MEFDLTNCEKEPIHIPAAIQPFGFLLCLHKENFTIQVVSENCQQYLALSQQQLLGKPLTDFISDEQYLSLQKLCTELHHESKVGHISFDKLKQSPTFKAIMHEQDGLFWLELEKISDDANVSIEISKLNQVFKSLSDTITVKEFCQRTAEHIQEITAFDRVMIYKFKPDESGEVIAEARKEDIEPYLDLHYPASDIPSQAREMYKKNLLRFIPDVNYQPVKISPVLHPDTAQPLNMSQSVLRSVSPIHLQYLKNMGIASSMSVSLLKDGKLWGLIACHHLRPHLIDYDRRELCKLIGRAFSVLIQDKEQKENQAYHLSIRDAQSNLFNDITGKEDFSKALKTALPLVHNIFKCNGTAMLLDNELLTIGETPEDEEIRQLIKWLQQHIQDEVFSTHQLTTVYPEGETIRQRASGLLAISISKVQGDYILWFRQEVIQTINWAGNPQKPVEITESGEQMLSPRSSFAAWKEQVKGKAIAWQTFEVQIAKEIRTFLVDILLQVAGELRLRADILARLNDELEESNTELDSFAFIASHDLKEPLRGIHNYATFLLEDYQDKLDDEGKNKLNTLIRLSERLRALIDSLYQFSRIGRLSLSFTKTNMQDLVEEVIDLLHFQLEATHTKVVIDGRLPTVICDKVRVPEIFNNLITNAIKYNFHSDKEIRIGCFVEPSATNEEEGNKKQERLVFYVQDNGIGIETKFFETIFQMFKRLNPPSKFGQGSGVGLSIVKKIVEKHGGKIWLESKIDQGTTFYFTLASAPNK